MSRFLNSKLSSLTPYVPGEQPSNMQKLIKLNTNESPFPPSPEVSAVMTGTRAETLRLYPDPECFDLRNAIAEYNGLEPENVMPGNGSDEILAFCFHGLCGKGAAFADITYGFYKVYAEMFSVPFIQIPLLNDFSIRVEDYNEIISTVFIANPNAPTGLCLAPEKIEELLRQDMNRLVVVDEAYIEFGGKSAAPLTGKYDNLIIVRTMSKSHSLAGARVGYALACRELIADLITMKFSFNPYNINRMSLLAGAAAMRDRQYYDTCRGEIIESRDFALLKFRKLGFKVLDSRANFIFAGEHPDISACDYLARLRENGILVRWFDSPRIENFVRITVGTHSQMRELITVTERIIREVKYAQG